MRAVKNTNLSRSVTLKVVGHDYIEPCLMEGELARKVVARLNNPKVEELTRVEHIVLVAEVDFLVPRVTGNYSVNESVAEEVFLFNPSLEVLAQAPEVSVFQNARLKVVTVSVDKLTGKEYEAAKALVKSSLEKKGELAGEGNCRSVGHLIGALELNTRLGGVGNHESEIGVICKREVSLKIAVGLNRSRNYVDDLLFNGGDTVFHTAHNVSVNAVLCFKHFTHALVNGLNDDDGCVKVGRFVCKLNYPVNEAAKEATLAKLYNLSFSREF